MVRLVVDAAVRGLIEFYLRWNNIVDQYASTAPLPFQVVMPLPVGAYYAPPLTRYGWSFVIEGGGVRPRTSEWANETTAGTIKRKGCMKAQPPECAGVGFLPYDLFPRHGRWPDLAPRALVYHMTIGCAEEKAPCAAPGVRPFKGNRQRLDRYDETDFDDMVTTLRGIGAWMVDATPDYSSPFTYAAAKEAL